jgi:hypothetical protein
VTAPHARLSHRIQKQFLSEATIPGDQQRYVGKCECQNEPKGTRTTWAYDSDRKHCIRKNVPESEPETEIPKIFMSIPLRIIPLYQSRQSRSVLKQFLLQYPTGWDLEKTSILIGSKCLTQFS